MSNSCGKFERRVTDVVVLVLLWYSIPKLVPLLWCLLTRGNIWVKLYGGAYAVGFGWFFGLCIWLAIREEYDEWKTSRQKKGPDSPSISALQLPQRQLQINCSRSFLSSRP